MKKCSKCGNFKTLDRYYQRKTGSRAGQYYEKCKACYTLRGRNYYQQHRETQLSLAKARKLKYITERKLFLNNFKNKPCFDCGVIYPPWVMDFDHKDSQSKIANVSKLAFRKIASIEKILDEINKCDLVCANCHRQRTYRRLHL